jgi:hypothetical protein
VRLHKEEGKARRDQTDHHGSEIDEEACLTSDPLHEIEKEHHTSGHEEVHCDIGQGNNEGEIDRSPAGLLSQERIDGFS